MLLPFYKFYLYNVISFGHWSLVLNKELCKAVLGACAEKKMDLTH